MPSIRNILSTTLLLALLSPILAHTPSQFTKDQEAESDTESFQKLLDQVDPPSLHAALHDYSPKKFKHGMFQEDRNAVKAIHVTEPKAAHSIIELAKRQSPGTSNGTLPTSSSPQASTPAPASTSDQVATPVAPIAPGSTLVPASSGSIVQTASSAPASSVTTTSPATSFTPTTSFSSSLASSTPVTTSAPASSSSLSNGQVITTTDSSGHIIVSTIGGGVQTITPSGSSSSSATHSSITSTTIRTTTLADGSQSTTTAITVIQASNTEAPTPAGNAGASSSKTGNAPGLQTGEAVMSRGLGMEGMAVLVGALGFAAMM